VTLIGGILVLDGMTELSLRDRILLQNRAHDEYFAARGGGCFAWLTTCEEAMKTEDDRCRSASEAMGDTQLENVASLLLVVARRRSRGLSARSSVTVAAYILLVHMLWARPAHPTLTRPIV
jgi:hypothetical protein